MRKIAAVALKFMFRFIKNSAYKAKKYIRSDDANEEKKRIALLDWDMTVTGGAEAVAASLTRAFGDIYDVYFVTVFQKTANLLMICRPQKGLLSRCRKHPPAFDNVGNKKAAEKVFKGKLH